MLSIYKASAGSGKTYTLAKQYIMLLMQPNGMSRSHRRILAVTFTHKATNEMKTRILKELYNLAYGLPSGYRSELAAYCKCSEQQVNNNAKTLLVDILQDYSAFSISTIDSFFQQIIRAFARDMSLSGSYNIELDTADLLGQAVDNLFFELDKDENQELMKWMTEFVEQNVADGKAWNPRKNIETLSAEIFKENYQSQLQNTNQQLHDKDFLKSYRDSLKDIVGSYEKELQKYAQEALNVMQKYGLVHSDFSRSFTQKLDALSHGDISGLKLADENPMGKTFHNGILNDVEKCFTKTSPKKDDIRAAYNDGFSQAIQGMVNYVEQNTIQYNTAQIILKNLSTLGIMSDVAEQIKKVSQEQNSMPISDTNLLLNNIINQSDAPFVYEKTGVNIHHFMIDEFQDTSTMQWKNFRPLIANSVALGHKNILVGDVKQSIYRWRNSDWNLLDSEVPNDKGLSPSEQQLDTNWRSCNEIVEFNNDFFGKAAEAVSGLISEEYGCRISKAYDSVKQKCALSGVKGQVTIGFVESGEDESWRDIALKYLLDHIRNLQQQKVPLHDIAILTRKTTDAQQVTQFLLEHNYSVVSNEGLLIAGASAVHFLLGLLRWFVNPEDSIQRLNVNYDYARFILNLPPDEALAKAVETDGFLFPEDNLQALERLRHCSLYDMVGQIVDIFSLYTWPGNELFVRAFLDCVFSYAANKTSDILNFLEWWNIKGQKQTIPMPEVKDAIQVMTVHKSKGLEFKIVFIPFCDWDLGLGTHRNIIWVEPNCAPFNQLSLVPVACSSVLGNSIFSNDYYDELTQTYIDNLNVLYVAFTRPQQQLYCLCPKPKMKEESAVPIKDIPTLVWNCIGQEPVFVKNDDFDTEEEECSASDQTDLAPEHTVAASAVSSVSTWHKLTLKRFAVKQEGIESNRLNLGIIMHEILCGIKIKSDQETAIANMLASGRLSHVEAEFVRNEFKKFWQLPNVAEWFNGKYKVLNEAAILTPDGNSFRPDRLMIDANGKAVIVDYKFGNKKLPAYHKQVKRYMDLVTQMGYTTQGYLCYVELNEIVEVS